MKRNSSIRNILFLNPPDPALIHGDASATYSYFEPPLGLLYVYAFMKRRKGVHVKFVDMNIEMRFLSDKGYTEIIASLVHEFEPDVVAITTLYYSGIDVFHKLISRIKAVNPDVITVFGGGYPTHLTEQCLSDDNLDYVVLSDGELGFSDLIDALNSDIGVRNVEGIAFKENGAIITNKRKTFWKGFPDSPRLPWEDTHFQNYFKEGRNVLYRIREPENLRIASITATRGCPNRCTYCTSPSFWDKRWWKRNVRNVIGEIEYLKDHYGVNTIVFNDENISVDKKWFIELLDALTTINITWISSGGLSIRTINDETVIRKMYESGIGLFNLAVESGSDETLKRIKKPLTVEETENVVRMIRRLGQGVIIGFFIVGFPFDNLSDVKQTLHFAEVLDLDWKCFYCFQPFPGCELFQDCRRQNLLLEDFNTDYGEVYFASKIKYPDYTYEELNRLNYLANLKCNFVNNRNLLLGTPSSLAQAERDFRYVIDMIPDHALAYWGLSETMRLRNRYTDHKKHIEKAHSIVDAKNADWKPYLQELSITL